MGVAIKSWRDETEVTYELKTKFSGGDLAQASLLLSALHIAEKDLIEYIDGCEPDLKIEG